ncbi:MAG: zinc-ribbon domain-containing protein [Rhodothermia bacterium]|nr:MAG: zinc-ribbon domain-containing protein [Rhodothermia bacterium]
MSKSCSGCGSRLKEDATQCDLCGTLVSGAEEELRNHSDSEEADLDASSDSTVRASGSVFCNSCGWKNPPDSNYCSKCGTELQKRKDQLPDSPSPPFGGDSDPEQIERNPALVGGVEPGAGKRIAILIGVSVFLIFAVYLLIVTSGQKGNVSTVPSSKTPLNALLNAPVEPPLIAEFASREDDLQAELDGLSGEDRNHKQRELLTLYFTARRFDLAGAKAEEIALETGSESAWIDAGNFYYDWMETSEPENKYYYSRKSTSAYRKVLETDPDNLDIRTDMAVAYLYDPENSMLAIQETMKVLEADSNHVQANFNRGIMLWQIDRLEDAIDQFEKVVRLVNDPDDPVSQRASEALSTLRVDSAGNDSGP